jgi:O-antigen ligase
MVQQLLTRGILGLYIILMIVAHALYVIWIREKDQMNLTNDFNNDLMVLLIIISGMCFMLSLSLLTYGSLFDSKFGYIGSIIFFLTYSIILIIIHVRSENLSDTITGESNVIMEETHMISDETDPSKTKMLGLVFGSIGFSFGTIYYLLNLI